MGDYSRTNVITRAQRRLTSNPRSAPKVSASVLKQLATVARRAGVDPLALRLRRIQKWLRDDVALLDGRIADLVDSGELTSADLAERAAAHLLKQPGKRVRPLCVVLAARLGGRDLDNDVLAAATAAELVHAATLLHDDVIDLGMERRGAPTARLIYGNSVSILAGDHLLVEALKSVGAIGSPQLVTNLLETISAMVSAEAAQLARRGNFRVDREAYLQVVRGKTAALFRWALWAGGMLADLDQSSLEALSTVGLALGLAFQLTDDCLDYDGDPAATGKDLLADLDEGKLTWPLILALERHPNVVRRLNTENCADLVPELVALVHHCGALEMTRAMAEAQVEIATKALKTLPPNKARRALGAVVKAIVRRRK